jgi:hypothetical protein
LERSLSVRFDSVLGDDERGALVAVLTSHAARLASWMPLPDSGRTYGFVRYGGVSPAAALREGWPAATVDDPSAVVLDIGPLAPPELQRVANALAGPGGPAGVRDAVVRGDVVTVELDAAITPLALVVDVVAVETRGTPPAIRPVLPLSDRVLAAFAGDALGAGALDERRLIETFSEPLLAGERPCS